MQRTGTAIVARLMYAIARNAVRGGETGGG